MYSINRKQIKDMTYQKHLDLYFWKRGEFKSIPGMDSEEIPVFLAYGALTPLAKICSVQLTSVDRSYQTMGAEIPTSPENSLKCDNPPAAIRSIRRLD